MKQVEKVVDVINRLVGYGISIMLFAMSIIIIAQVICRASHIPLSWSEETARYLMIYITFLGMAYACRYDKMMSVKFLQQMLPDKYVHKMSIFALVLQITFFAVMIVQGVAIIKIVHSQLSPALLIPMSIPYSAMMAGGTIAILNCLFLLVALVFKQKVCMTAEISGGD